MGARFRAPARAGQLVRVGIETTVENPRRLRHQFEIRDDNSNQLLAEGFVRVGCVSVDTFQPRDLPHDVMVFEIIEALAGHTLPRRPITSGAEQSPSSDEPI